MKSMLGTRTILNFNQQLRVWSRLHFYAFGGPKSIYMDASNVFNLSRQYLILVEARHETCFETCFEKL